MVWFPSMWCCGLDAGSDQRAEGEPESDSEEVVNGTGAHGKGSDDGRARRLAGLTLDDEFGVTLAVHVGSDTGQLDLGAVCHGRANECRHGASECADVHQACRMPLLEFADFALF